MLGFVRGLVSGVKQRGAALTLALVSLVASGSAMAQTSEVVFDPASTLAIVASAQAFIVAVGLAVLYMVMTGKGVKWARRAG